VKREEFNSKYSSFLEDGFPGLVIDDTGFIDQLDNFFGEITKIKGFKYYKISEGNHLTLEFFLHLDGQSRVKWKRIYPTYLM